MPPHDPERPSPPLEAQAQQYREEALRLTDQAMAALDGGELKEARRLCERLREMRFSSCFEIEALILLDEDELPRAIEVLREGVEMASQSWVMWQLLGNCLSDSGQFDEALSCYATGLDLDGAHRASLLFNRATVLGRVERREEALQVLEQVLGALEADAIERGERVEMRGRVWALRLRLLDDLGRCGEVRAEARELKAWFEEVAARTDDKEASNWQREEESLAWSLSGYAVLGCGQAEEAREWARRALMAHRCNRNALGLLREAGADAPLAMQFFVVDLEGDWPFEEGEEEAENLGFLSSLSVVARDEDEACALALEMEGTRWEQALRVSSCEPGGECKEHPVGVFEVFGYRVFSRGADDEDEDEAST